jgi:hypothetical protein
MQVRTDIQLNFEEAVHKLMKINIPEGKEVS